MVPVPGGGDVAVYDFGGNGPDLLLVHATGFCAGVLAPLASFLGANFRCWALDLRAHGRSLRPPSGHLDWSGFADDVLAAVDDLGLEAPRGFGHSCGGASLLLAEQQQPGTFAGLYLFEPVVVPDDMFPPSGDSNPLSDGARRRRAEFPSPEAAFVNFAAKPPFATLDSEVLRRYVEDGFEVIPDDQGGDGAAIRLRCRRDDEAEVYLLGMEHGAFGRLGQVACPTTLAYGKSTQAFGRSVMEADGAQMPRARVEALAGMGHFGPLEEPSQVAQCAVRALGAPWTTKSTAADDTPTS